MVTLTYMQLALICFVVYVISLVSLSVLISAGTRKQAEEIQELLEALREREREVGIREWEQRKKEIMRSD